MTEINHLIKLNIEMEGILRILADRNDDDARALLAEKFEQYNNAMHEFIKTPDSSCPEQPSVDIHHNEETPVEESPEPAPEEPVVEVTEAAVVTEATRTPNNVLKAFTLNDRFRFRRELFGGNDADFTDTLTLLSDMDTYEEASDYLCNDMMWDPENPEVSAFLEILSNNMPR